MMRAPATSQPCWETVAGTKNCTEPKTAMKVLVVPILQIMASDGGDEDTEGADAADGGCEGVMGNGSNCYDCER